MAFPLDRLMFLVKLTGAVIVLDDANIPYEKKMEICFAESAGIEKGLFWQFQEMNIIKAPDFRRMGQGKEVSHLRTWIETRVQAYLSVRYGETPTIGSIFANEYPND